MIEFLGHTTVWLAAITFLVGGCWVDYKLWRLALGFVKREWRAWRGEEEQAEEPKTRYGRISVTSDGRGRTTHVQVVPFDGGEPIEIPVFSVKVQGMWNERVTAHIHAAVSSVDVATGVKKPEVRITSGGTHHSGIVGPNIEIIEDGEPVRARGFIWAIKAKDVYPRLYIRGRRDS